VLAWVPGQGKAPLRLLDEVPLVRCSPFEPRQASKVTAFGHEKGAKPRASIDACCETYD